jgi:glutamyl-Q tRNA(Asp) synthetase
MFNSPTKKTHYVGRFAPSPSGPLHFGSLVTALGSFLQAKSHQGHWLLRIEDIDGPREILGASEAIVRCLEAHHLFWDGPVVYQSGRNGLYNEKISRLMEQGFTYFCQCTRKQLSELKVGQLCPCNTLSLGADSTAVRFRYDNYIGHFDDVLLGHVDFPVQACAGHFTIKRKDGLYAYQLAVVVDDIQQGITEVARGADLLDVTGYQLALYQALNHKAPRFLHFPVVVSQPGKKLSKQNHACALDLTRINLNIQAALEFLGLDVPRDLHTQTTDNMLTWAINEWDISKIVAKTECIDNRIGSLDSI